MVLFSSSIVFRRTEDMLVIFVIIVMRRGKLVDSASPHLRPPRFVAGPPPDLMPAMTAAAAYGRTTAAGVSNGRTAAFATTAASHGHATTAAATTTAATTTAAARSHPRSPAAARGASHVASARFTSQAAAARPTAATTTAELKFAVVRAQRAADASAAAARAAQKRAEAKPTARYCVTPSSSVPRSTLEESLLQARTLRRTVLRAWRFHRTSAQRAARLPGTGAFFMLAALSLLRSTAVGGVRPVGSLISCCASSACRSAHEWQRTANGLSAVSPTAAKRLAAKRGRGVLRVAVMFGGSSGRVLAAGDEGPDPDDAPASEVDTALREVRSRRDDDDATRRGRKDLVSLAVTNNHGRTPRCARSRSRSSARPRASRRRRSAGRRSAPRSRSRPEPSQRRRRAGCRAAARRAAAGRRPSCATSRSIRCVSYRASYVGGLDACGRVCLRV